jgi:hypothetical protein
MTLPQSASAKQEMWTAQTRYLHIAIVCAATIFGYPAVAQGVQCVFEFPEGVAVEIEA